jgi:hypothetical protein
MDRAGSVLFRIEHATAAFTLPRPYWFSGEWQRLCRHSICRTTCIAVETREKWPDRQNALGAC